MGSMTACGKPSDAVFKASAASSAVPLEPTASVTAEPSTVPSATATADVRSVIPAPPTPAKPAKTRAAPKPPPARAGSASAAEAILDQINGWRTAAGLRPYVMLPGLVASAHKHNLTMAAGCGLSHQCPGEAPFGDRIHAEGVQWHGAGENCGVGGAADNQAAITAAGKGLNQAMFDEKPPGDGHRRNLLSSGFTHIGIDVIRDSKGKVWLTQDFTS